MILVDIETVPKTLAEIEAAMPDEMKNPFIPEALENPVEPDFAADCPAYSIEALTAKLTQAQAGVSAAAQASVPPTEKQSAKLNAALEKAEAAVAEAKAKRATWIEEKREAWQEKNADALVKIKADATEARAKFIDGAALDARLCRVKLIGVRDTSKKTTTVFVFEPDKARVVKLTEYAATLKSGLVVIVPAMLEKQTLKAFFGYFAKVMETPTVTACGSGVTPLEIFPDCVTYFGNSWDFPLMYRKAWILGLPQIPLYRRGRYFTERMVDLHELWQCGDNRASVGGLDGLCEALGVSQCKTGDGASFHKYYDQDPTEGLTYLLNDLDATEACAGRMGAL